MNIKSLLLGSAAAMVAASGAQAADAIIFAEPEPTEYVRICDTYGAGFYYIPGTETCLRVGGYLRYDVAGGDVFEVPSVDKRDWARFLAGDIGLADVSINDTYYQRARAAIQLDARSETELGTLRGYVHANFDYTTGIVGAGLEVDVLGFPIFGIDGPASTSGWNTWIEHAFIELGGFRVGMTDSMFSTFTGYTSGVSNDGLAVPYGPFATHQISYTFSGGNGFSAAIALESGAGGSYADGFRFGPFGAFGYTEYLDDLYAIDSYMPHVVAGVGFEQAWGGIKAVVGYDSVWEEWAAKLRADFNFGAGSIFVMGGWKSNGGAGDIPFNYYAQWGGDWAIWAGGAFDVTENATVNVELAYDDSEVFHAIANVAWSPVENFTITPEIAYVDTPGGDGWGGFLRFQRNF